MQYLFPFFSRNDTYFFTKVSVLADGAPWACVRGKRHYRCWFSYSSTYSAVYFLCFCSSDTQRINQKHLIQVHQWLVLALALPVSVLPFYFVDISNMNTKLMKQSNLSKQRVVAQRNTLPYPCRYSRGCSSEDLLVQKTRARRIFELGMNKKKEEKWGLNKNKIPKIMENNIRRKIIFKKLKFSGVCICSILSGFM